MHANNAVMDQPNGGGMPWIGKAVALVGSGVGSVVPPPVLVAPRLCAVPVPPLKLKPVFPVTPVTADDPEVGGVVDAPLAAPVFPVLPVFAVGAVAFALAWARPSVTDVVIV
jgi:hypothetical protein